MQFLANARQSTPIENQRLWVETSIQHTHAKVHQLKKKGHRLHAVLS